LDGAAISSDAAAVGIGKTVLVCDKLSSLFENYTAANMPGWMMYVTHF
jgi:hypothetical protein